jgi:hypothetical protein
MKVKSWKVEKLEYDHKEPSKLTAEMTEKIQSTLFLGSLFSPSLWSKLLGLQLSFCAR